MHKDFVEVTDFESFPEEFLNDRIQMLLRNNKMINGLNRYKTF